MQRLINRIIPFIMVGIAIVAFAFGIFLLAYLFLFGAIMGLILYLAALIKDKLFPSKTVNPPAPTSGRTIDSDDWKVL